MTDRISIPYCSNSLAAALLRGMKEHQAARIDIDCIRAACIGYLAANLMELPRETVEEFIAATTRKLVEKVG